MGMLERWRRGAWCLGFLAALGCGSRSSRATFNGQDGAAQAPQSAPQASSASTAIEPAGARVELADTVRLEGDRIYLFGEQRGLVAYDVSDVDRPHELWSVPIAGDPIALFVRKGVALLVTGGDGRSKEPTSSMRAMDVRATHAPIFGAQVAIPGSVYDVHAVGDVFYALSEVGADPMASSVVLTSFRLEAGALHEIASVRVAGTAPSFAVGRTKIALAWRASDSENTEVMIAEVGAGGAPTLRGSLQIRGVVSPRVEPQLDPSEGFVRIVTSLPAGGRPVLSIIDARDASAPRLVTEMALPSSRGVPAGVFHGDRLYIVDNPGLSLSDGTSVLSTVDLVQPEAPRMLGSLELPGSLSNVIPLGDRTLAIATHGAPTSAIHVLVHAIDVVQGKPPALLGSTEFGETWTATMAASQPALAVDDRTSRWLALPFSTWREDAHRYANGVEVFRRTPHGYEDWGAARTVGWVERVLFLRGRFIGVTAAGLTVVDPLHAARSIPLTPSSPAGEGALR